jgi:predicted DNA-binding transcriptional regulator AlpA
MTEAEVAQALRCSKAILRKWRASKTGPRYLKIGRMVRYPVQAVEEFLSCHMVGESANREGNTAAPETSIH